MLQGHGFFRRLLRGHLGPSTLLATGLLALLPAGAHGALPTLGSALHSASTTASVTTSVGTPNGGVAVGASAHVQVGNVSVGAQTAAAVTPSAGASAPAATASAAGTVSAGSSGTASSGTRATAAVGANVSAEPAGPSVSATAGTSASAGGRGARINANVNAAPGALPHVSLTSSHGGPLPTLPTSGTAPSRGGARVTPAAPAPRSAGGTIGSALSSTTPPPAAIGQRLVSPVACSSACTSPTSPRRDAARPAGHTSPAGLGAAGVPFTAAALAASSPVLAAVSRSPIVAADWQRVDLPALDPNAFSTPQPWTASSGSAGGAGASASSGGGGAGSGSGLLFAAIFILSFWAGRRLLPKSMGVPSAPLVLLPDRPG